ncbi:MAG: hypothetical protein ACQEW8_07345 [Actinomycetota bacterium]
MNESKDAPPDGLGERGTALWSALTRDIEFAPQEAEVLVEACRTLDRIDDLTDVLDRDGTMISGSMGQRILHPAVAEVRQLQAAFVRLSGALNLPEDKAADEAFRTKRAKAGAAARHGLRAV